MITRGSFVHTCKPMVKFQGPPKKVFCKFLKMLMISDKTIQKAFRIHKTLYTLNQISKSPPNILSNISKSILPILIIQTIIDREFSYAKNEWYMSANWWHCFCEIMHFMTKGVKKILALVICVRFYTNNKGITHVSIYCIIYCMSLHVFLLISITMNEVFNNW